jgi:AraC-like DNA-binding protein
MAAGSSLAQSFGLDLASSRLPVKEATPPRAKRGSLRAISAPLSLGDSMNTLLQHQISIEGRNSGTRAQAGKPSATILVSHVNASAAVGLLNMLRRLPESAFEVWDGTQGPWSHAPNSGEADPVVGVAESFAPLVQSASDDAPPRAEVAPRVVVIATRAEADPILVPGGSDACLPVGYHEAELFVMRRQQTRVSAAEGALEQAVPHQDEPDPRAATAAGTIRRPSGGLAPGGLRRVREHVEAHLSERIRLSELAAIAGLSDCHFSRAFKQSVGVPPHRYIMTRRVAAAARLMQDSDRPLIEISHAVGFFDQSHFTRVFVDLMGETPRGFRWRHR